MGIPDFFGWLTKKYPLVIEHCVEKQRSNINRVKARIDTLQVNRNNVEFDNLYLDMNGLIHPCTNPEDKPAPRNEEEIMIAIFECIDRLFAIVRPRKLLYLAIDGVAPRAKMNQQRSRRFRAIKETIDRNRTEQEDPTKPSKKSEERFDSNCITPGTPFMARLSECLNFYIHHKINKDPRWSNINVILSDANVPGEGEHKIMDFIRKQRLQPNYDPNTRHCLYGNDADFIVLGLATHEAHFTIIREKFEPNKPKPRSCYRCGQIGHSYKECAGDKNIQNENFMCEKEYVYIQLSVLREYLEIELKIPELSFQYDFERAIDDWVFLCILVGNDFLPRLQSLDIREGAIDELVKIYKEVVLKTGDYLTKNGDLHLDKIELMMCELGKLEEQTFISRHQNKENFKAREKANIESLELNNPIVSAHDTKQKWLLAEKDYKCDEIRLWENGFKDRYYESKFDMGKNDLQFRHNVALQYVKGLCWVLRYYCQGCPSWRWYYPYHYAPFASDFVNIGKLSSEFDTETKPFTPLEQLMSVFPASSGAHVPQAWADLMINESSPIIDFYPKDFKIDLNGQKFAWQGVAMLPFVDENRLIRELSKVYHKLTSAEKERNVLRNERLYIRIQHENFQMLEKLTYATIENNIFIDGIQGTISKCKNRVGHGKSLQSPLKCLPLIAYNRVCCVSFTCLKYPNGFVFPPIRLHGSVEPPKILNQVKRTRNRSNFTRSKKKKTKSLSVM